MRVLLVAEQCNPALTSVPLQVANYCRAISLEIEETTVVTAIRNKPAIDEKGLGKANVRYIDNERLSWWTWKLSSLLRAGHDLSAILSIPLNRNFEKRALNEIIKTEDLPFDIVHRISPASSAIPSWLATRSPSPFVLGPINGGLPYPPSFKFMQLKEGEIFRFFRGAVNCLPGYTESFVKPSAVLASFPHTALRIPSRNPEKIIEMPDVGADSSLFYPTTNRRKSVRCRFIFVGRLVPFKCPSLLVEAFAESEILKDHELIIVGDGPERQRIESKIRKHSLQENVKCLGMLPQAEVAEQMRASDVFAFPSIRDSGGAVTPEAMMSGLPCIAVDYGPPSSLLCDESGVLVKLGSWRDHVVGFREAMEMLALNEQLREKMGRMAYQRAKEIFSWEYKAKRIREVYQWALGQQQCKPSFYL